jgi:mannose-6-phosphate isomerase-like protein (cupin superfamily)
VLDTERLAAIADALGLPPQSLFPKSPNRHFQITHQSNLDSLPSSTLNVVDKSTGLVGAHHNLLRPLAGEFVGKHVAPFRIEILPVPDDEVRFISHHHEEFFVVVSGELECLIRTPEGVARQVLVPGDCVYFRSSLPTP